MLPCLRFLPLASSLTLLWLTVFHLEKVRDHEVGRPPVPEGLALGQLQSLQKWFDVCISTPAHGVPWRCSPLDSSKICLATSLGVNRKSE